MNRQHRTKEERSEGGKKRGYLDPPLVPPLGPSRPRQGCSPATRLPQPSVCPQHLAAPHSTRASTRRTRALLRGPAEPRQAPGVLSARPRELRPLGWREGRALRHAHSTLGGVVSGYLPRVPAPHRVLPAPARSWAVGVFTRLSLWCCWRGRRRRKGRRPNSSR